MSIETNVLSSLINRSLLGVHTAYIGKVVKVSGKYASVQPLTLQKMKDGTIIKQALQENVPILRNARYKISATTIDSKEVAKIEKLEKGDIVLCVCCERDITEAKNGKSAVPATRHHSMSDSMIVGCF